MMSIEHSPKHSQNITPQKGNEGQILSRKTVLITKGDERILKSFEKRSDVEVDRESPRKRTLVFRGVDLNGEEVQYTYTGDSLPKTPHGYGTFQYPHQRELKGVWLHGVPEGKVYFSDHHSFCYVGEWINGSADGDGKYESLDGAISFTGKWEEGKPHGSGTISIKNDEGIATFKGSWRNGKIDGYGVAKYPNGDSISGSWINGKLHGKATYIFRDGSTSTAEWTQGLLLNGINTPKNKELRILNNVNSNTMQSFNYVDQTQDIFNEKNLSVPMPTN